MRPPLDPRARAERGLRVHTLVIASAGLILMALVMLAIAALIKLTCGGPVFYRGTRVGLGRRGRIGRDASVGSGAAGFDHMTLDTLRRPDQGVRAIDREFPAGGSE